MCRLNRSNYLKITSYSQKREPDSSIMLSQFVSANRMIGKKKRKKMFLKSVYRKSPATRKTEHETGFPFELRGESVGIQGNG